MRIALAQINPLIGDISGNADRIRSRMHEAASGGADLVIFPELTICGYPPKDLVLKPKFVDDCVAAVRRLAGELRGLPAAIIGYVRHNDDGVGRKLRNAAALIHNGGIAAEYFKSLLPTYDVFDEHRYFEPGRQPGVVSIAAGGREWRVGIAICEDLWNDKRVLGRQLYHENPIDELVRLGVDMVVNPSASPFVVGKQALRERLIGTQAASARVPIAYVNQVGGNDELIFDGASCLFDAAGRIAARARAFDEDLLVVDLAHGEQETGQRNQPEAQARASHAPNKVWGASLRHDPKGRAPTARHETYPDDLNAVWQALVMGTRDYLTKCGFKEVVIGLSGGIDSALVACIAAEALGASRVHGVAMPSRYSSDHSISDAKSLAANLGINFQVIPIEPMHAAFEKGLSNSFAGRPPDLTEENMQARIRGNVLMSLSNKFGWLLLTTGNKSELAVGYCTLYGDMCGGLAVISDVPKMMVYDLARRYNEKRGSAVIPESSLTKLPSAELRPDQHDQQSLPPYEVLDAILYRYVEQEQSAAEIIAAGFDDATVRDVIRKIDVNEYKRKQAATGLKVTSRAFGVGRRMPIAARFS